MNKKGGFTGVMLIWLGVLIGMFTITVIYIGMTESIDIMDELLGSYIQNGTHKDTYDYVIDAWDDWPIYFHIVFIIFGIVGTFINTRDQSYSY